MHSKSDNIEIMINDQADEVRKESFDSLKNRYQNNLNFQKQIVLFKNKKATINLINKKANFFNLCKSRVKSWRNKKRFAKSNKIKSFINRYNCKGINLPSKIDDLKKIDQNNVTIDLNVCRLKVKKYILLIIENITQIVKNKLLF